MQDYVWTGEIGIQYHIFAESEEQARTIILNIYGEYNVIKYFSKYKLSIQPMPNGLVDYSNSQEKILYLDMGKKNPPEPWTGIVDRTMSV